MTLLRADELLSSTVVANSTMNRGRGLSGVNSYERDLRFAILPFLAARVQERGSALWYDACCGQGRALMEAGRQLAAMDWGGCVQIVGADLVGMFAPERAQSVSLMAADVAAFRPDRPADLVTCVHGLHYLGDKLGFLESAHAMLAPDGLFLGHLDPNNVRLADSGASAWRLAARQARINGVSADLKSYILRFERAEAVLRFGMSYQGASVSETQNYTGITVIDSWYTQTE